ncbi:MAG: hypothetical protein Q7K57_07045 [Burkholderiaceae bacterium]|nr:hypothetical protein [Burkholderiaceae bacterium]
MLSRAEINAANEYGEVLRIAVHEIEMPPNERVRAAAGCLAIGQDVHHAIVKLVESRLYAGAFALVRVAFEAYVRGEWLWLCAKNNQVRRFLKGAEPPKLGLMLDELEKHAVFREQVLSQIKRHTWKAMCAYTHVGGLHVQRWVTADGIEPNYSAEEVREVLRFADIIVALSVVGLLGVADTETAANAAEKVLEHYKARLGVT